MKNVPSFKGFFVVFSLALLLMIPNLGLGSDVSKGNILGFIYDADGTTPVTGAVVKVKSLSTGSVYESSISDTHGVFKILGIESGVYVYGVRTEKGEFNSDGMIGVNVEATETAKMAITLTPFSSRVLKELKEGMEANSIEGETLVGRILDFNPESGLAEVYILQGTLAEKDKIHAFGVETDFYQNVKNLEVEGNSVKNTESGETAKLHLNESAMVGDFVYLVAEKGFAILSVIPVGVAALVGTSAAIVKVEKNTVNDQPRAASAYKK